MIKEIPILFSTAMVQALLEGRKTQTRRIIDPQPSTFITALSWGKHVSHCPEDCSEELHVMTFFNDKSRWKPGDLLWVRENFRVASWMPDDGEISFRYEADGEKTPSYWFEEDMFNRYWEQSCADLSKAGYEPNDEERYADYDPKTLRLRPNIFLPKVAARIWLQVTEVRVERLKDITDADAIAEGIESYVRIADIIAYKNYSENARKDFLNVSKYGFDNGKETQSAPVASFCTLWIDINCRESWIANPWVWVISFKVLSTTGKPDYKQL